ncbi:hypothetical protein B9Q04_17140 [Candidatus Marsarchaeota G2 archaeon BE_D]|jgi:predicted ATPase|uniref:ATPase AAA-type core domain-containing protein n=1 Tax=Candidatus Marsarchaeota G2 archaeon BE_D TaxID=1978158 RepID=A0A2R6C5N2_9ARCH|nr:MAG: hypothetical protein B9Q04_17140 [Candidatus Marsarchaeota G2 archaeon BE_D]
MEIIFVPIDYKRVRIKNFKSLENVEIGLEKLNVIVGPNGSGKTNLFEAFLFAKSTVRPSIYPPYPFLYWWGYKNMVYMHDISRNVEFGVSGEVKTREGVLQSFSYSLAVNGAGEKLRIIEERLDGGSFRITRMGSELKVYLHEREVSSYEILDLRYSVFNLFAYPAKVFDEERGKWRLVLQANVGLLNGPPQVLVELDEQSIDALVELYWRLFSDVYLLKFSSDRARTPSVPGSIIGIDGYGLFSVLQEMYSGVGPEKKPEGFLDYFLDRFNIRLRFQNTEFQTVLMKLVEDGLEVEPQGIPDGYLKAMAVLYLLDLKPSLLLVDELENHMHLKLIEHVISAFRASETKVLATTHSPLVIDLAKPEELILLYKRGRSTEARRTENPEALKAELAERGITLSESWLYGSLSGEI